MKYNVLLMFRDYLRSSGLSSSTASTYYKAMDYLLNDQILLDCSKLDIKLVLQKLQVITYKSYYSKYKNAFLKFCDYQNIKLSDKVRIELDAMKSDKIKKYRKPKPVLLTSIKNKIRVIRDRKLKLSLQIMLATGIRVSELSQVTTKDCTLANDNIKLSFIGKGGNAETVMITDSKIVSALRELLAITPKGEKLFYSANYLQKHARKRNFACHDLRRAFAKIVYKATKSIRRVMELMRHKKYRSSKIYLTSKVKI